MKVFCVLPLVSQIYIRISTAPSSNGFLYYSVLDELLLHSGVSRDFLTTNNHWMQLYSMMQRARTAVTVRHGRGSGFH